VHSHRHLRSALRRQCHLPVDPGGPAPSVALRHLPHTDQRVRPGPQHHFLQGPDLGPVPLPRRLEDPPPQPPYVALVGRPVNGVPVRHVFGSIHRHGVQLALRFWRLDQHQGSKAHLPTSAPFRASHRGWYPASYAAAVGGGADHVAVGFLLSFEHRHSLVGHPVPAAGFCSPHGRPTRQRLDLDGVSTFRTSESRPDWVPSLPRDQAVLLRPVRSLRPSLAPSSRGQVLSPRFSSHRPKLSVTRRHQGFTRVHPPGLPPRLADPLDGTGAVGLLPGLSHPNRQDLRRTPGRGTGIEHSPGAIPPTSSDLLIHKLSRDVRPRVTRSAWT
jgi:hypothetical protein